jgi:hypothetical protein
MVRSMQAAAAQASTVERLPPLRKNISSPASWTK